MDLKRAETYLEETPEKHHEVANAHEALAGYINEQVAAIKKYRRDAYDLKSGTRLNRYALFGMLVEGWTDNIFLENKLVLLMAGSIAVEVYMQQSLGHKNKTRLNRGYEFQSYSLQCLRTSHSSLNTKAGEVVAFIHPSSEAGNGRLVHYEQALMDIFATLSKTDIDGAIVPYDVPDVPEGAGELQDILCKLKGYDFRDPYTDDTKGIYLNKQEMQTIAGKNLHHKLLQAVERLYPVIVETNSIEAAQHIISRLLEQELISDSVIRVKGFYENGEFDITTAYRRPQVFGTSVTMHHDRPELKHMQSIASLAPLDISRSAEIIQRLDAGGHDSLSLLALAWQSMKQQADRPLLQVSGGNTYLNNPNVKLFSLKNSEFRRLLGRMGIATAASAIVLQGGLGILNDNNDNVTEAEMALSVQAHGNTSIDGYYAEESMYVVSGDTLQWKQEGQPYYDVSDNLAKSDVMTDDYLTVSIIREVDSNGLVELPIKEFTDIASLRVIDQDGKEWGYNVVATAEGLPRILLDATGKKVRVTYKLVSSKNGGIVYPQRPITAYGQHRPEQDPTFRFDLPAEDLAGWFSQNIRYNAGKPLETMLEGANASNITQKIYEPNGVADCEVASTVVALNNSVEHDDPMAYVEGFLVQDTEKPKEEFVKVGHAWLATQNKPHIDPTPPLPPGTTRADVGLPDTPQHEVAAEFNDAANEYQIDKNYPFPWEPLTAVGSLALIGALAHQRKYLGLAVARSFDLLRQKIAPEATSHDTLRGLLVYEDFAPFDKPIHAAEFSSLRQEIAAKSNDFTDASITNEALRRTIQGESALVKALLSKKERRSARRQTARIIRDRQWEALKQQRKEKKRERR